MYDQIFAVDDESFDALALETFRQQYQRVEVYRAFCDSLNKIPSLVNQVVDIPFLPIEFFKNHLVLNGDAPPQKIFESSGTTGVLPSRHHIADLSIYQKSILDGFRLFYGEAKDYSFVALLPSYIERGNSSLVYMADVLMNTGASGKSGFFLNEFELLYEVLNKLKREKRKTILLGVTFALLDFAEKYEISFPELIVMETGGMKGRRKELTRFEVHDKLQRALGVEKIHSEYGMTELLSQAYSKGDGVYRCPPWMKVFTRDIYDPLATGGNIGAMNVMDLANIHSCSFIATGDIGRINTDGSFEVLGRMDQAEVRGCNLMVA